MDVARTSPRESPPRAERGGRVGSPKPDPGRFLGLRTHRYEGRNLATPASPLLSTSQLATISEIGEERSAAAGELLYRVGDRIYPFVAILEGAVAIIDAAGNELIRQGPSGFLGELNLLSG